MPSIQYMKVGIGFYLNSPTIVTFAVSLTLSSESSRQSIMPGTKLLNCRSCSFLICNGSTVFKVFDHRTYLENPSHPSFLDPWDLVG